VNVEIDPNPGATGERPLNLLYSPQAPAAIDALIVDVSRRREKAVAAVP
jgi:hypothetical protein